MEQKNITATFLNTWGNSTGDRILDFLAEQRYNQTEFICLSEVFSTPNVSDEAVCYQNDWMFRLNSYQLIRNVLHEEYHFWYKPNSIKTPRCGLSNTQFKGVTCGNLLCVRKNVKTIYVLTKAIYTDAAAGKQRYCHMVITEINNVRYLIMHWHGLWIRGNTKGDSPERREQSENVIALLQKYTEAYRVNHVLFGGDFNLDIDVPPLYYFSDAGYRNLITESHDTDSPITDTRTKLYRDHCTIGATRYADYVFCSPGLCIESLKAPNLLISDHRALICTFRQTQK